jgi:glycosyltransferase involved in cell wall biosynthesis
MEADACARTRALVLIPARNEASTIARVVRGCRLAGFNVWVIDDGSTDATGSVAQAAGAWVLPVRGHNHGKTRALCLALARLPDCIKWIFFLDGDGQHEPRDLERFWRQRHEMDMVVGNRFPDAQRMPRLRRWTNRFMSALLQRSAVRDTQCGFRLVRREWLGSWLPDGHHFQFETELALLSASRPTRVLNLPIAAIYDREESKIRPWRDAVNFTSCYLRRPRRAANS